MSDVLISQLREALLDRREDPPAVRRRRVYVDREGKIVVGDDEGAGERRQLSEVHRAVFAAPRDRG